MSGATVMPMIASARRIGLLVGILTSVGASTSAAQAAAPDYLKKAQEVVRAAMKPPTFADIRPSTPAPPFKPGLRIAVILATARSTGAQIQARGVKDAAAAVGWTTVEFDGQGTNQGRLAAFRTVLTQKFDGIVLVAMDQRVVGDAMRDAHAQKIPVVSTMAGNQAGSEPDQVFANAGMDDLQEGRKVGSWIVADAAASGAKVNALLFLNPVNRTVEQRDAGVQAVLRECTDCKVAAAETYTSAEVFQTVPQRTQALLQLHPQVNYIMIDVGAYAVYVVQGLKQLGAGFEKKVKLISFDCVPDEIARVIARDVQWACEGAASEASGWAAIDELNRALNGQPRAGNAVPVQLITQENYAGVTTTAVGYTGPFDYKAEWRKFWGK
jgi:ribose transport system substrate-binding protein